MPHHRPNGSGHRNRRWLRRGLRSTTLRQSWPLGLLFLSVVWVCYRHLALRAAAAEILAEAEQLQSDVSRYSGRIRAFQTGFLQRPVEDFAGAFLWGTQRNSDRGAVSLRWPLPRDGLYLVVDMDCGWSQEAVEEALAGNNYEVFVLDEKPANSGRWLQEYQERGRNLWFVTPQGGWWRNSLPAGVTPVWFAVKNGTFIGVGVGAHGIRALLGRESNSRDPAPVLDGDLTT